MPRMRASTSPSSANRRARFSKREQTHKRTRSDIIPVLAAVNCEKGGSHSTLEELVTSVGHSRAGQEVGTGIDAGDEAGLARLESFKEPRQPGGPPLAQSFPPVVSPRERAAYRDHAVRRGVSSSGEERRTVEGGRRAIGRATDESQPRLRSCD